jgi:type VI secretion system protein ImpK
MNRAVDRRHAPAPSVASAATLPGMMQDGLHALHLLASGSVPADGEAFETAVLEFLARVENQGRAAGMPPEDVALARYAFCATADELVLRSVQPLRARWLARPLQLRLFGDQLAGEHFFDKLEDLRLQGAPKLQVLEIFHACLQAGFEGKYALHGAEKLRFVRARLGEEIIRLRGGPRALAPAVERPDNIVHERAAGRRYLAAGAVLVLAAVLAYAGMRALTQRQAARIIARHHHVVQLPPPPAEITITLP